MPVCLVAAGKHLQSGDGTRWHITVVCESVLTARVVPGLPVCTIFHLRGRMKKILTFHEVEHLGLRHMEREKMGMRENGRMGALTRGRRGQSGAPDQDTLSSWLRMPMQMPTCCRLTLDDLDGA